MRIFTARYGNSRSIKASGALPVRTSIGAPRNVAFHYESVVELAPDQYMLGLPRDVYEPIYLRKLEALGVKDAYGLLWGTGNGRDVVLLCYENLLKEGYWCHRRMFADWWTSETGDPVIELEDRVVVQKKITRLGLDVSKFVNGKAERLVRNEALTKTDTGWTVKGDHAVYIVGLDGEHCSCPAQGVCAHQLAVKITVQGKSSLF